MTNDSNLEARILILAPTGRDGPAVSEVLQRDSLDNFICTDVAALLAAMDEGAGAALIAEEAISSAAGADLVAWVERQPPWSDMPFIILTSRQIRPEVLRWRSGMLGQLRNASLLERPLDALTLSSVSRAAARSRLRQYEVRAYLQEKAAAAETLENLVTRRTQELEAVNTALRVQMTELERTEEALRQSQKMEAVGQLTGGLAHDFNNMLTGVIGSLELMQTRLAQGRTGELERYVTMATKSASRAAALTHRLLAFSRRQTLSPKPTNANALLDGMAELIRGTVGPGIDVNLIRTPDLWTIICDPNQLENALLNLVINARDAMPDGGTLTVQATNASINGAGARHPGEAASGQYVVLSVGDTGTGMPPDVVSRAFDPFFTTKPTGEGTGLGLSMVYGFAKQSAGDVRINSVLGQGTAVELYLPRHRGVAEAEEWHSPAQLEPRSRLGETVLVVDDEPAIRMLICEMLEDLGYGTAVAGDARGGLQILHTQSIHLLITDVGLPNGMNGRQLADAARRERPDLRVLFITGYAETAAMGGGQLEPGMEVVTKPFAIGALAARIQAMIPPTSTLP